MRAIKELINYILAIGIFFGLPIGGMALTLILPKLWKVVGVIVLALALILDYLVVKVIESQIENI